MSNFPVFITYLKGFIYYLYVGILLQLQQHSYVMELSSLENNSDSNILRFSVPTRGDILILIAICMANTFQLYIIPDMQTCIDS